MTFNRTWRTWLEAKYAGGADPTILTPLANFKLEPWSGETPEQQAARIDAFWDGYKLPSEQCGVHITFLVEQLTDPNRKDNFPQTPESIAQHFRTNMVDPKGLLDLMRRFYRALKRKPAFIYCDNEATLNRFGFPSVDWLKPIFDDPMCRRWMPAGLDGVTADQVMDFWSPGHTRRPCELWNGYAADLVRRSVDLIVRASGLLDTGARFVQAEAVNPRRPVYDFNGWEQVGRVVSSSTSNWFCYGGAGQRHQNLDVPPGWAALADEIEVVRACTDSGTQRSMCPHLITNPDPAIGDFCYPWVFEHLLGHIARTPQPGWPCRDVILFNPPATRKRELEVQALVIKHMSHRLAAVLPPVSLTQPTITTGNWTSSVADFKQHVPQAK
jgi:hypothetical protein